MKKFGSKLKIKESKKSIQNKEKDAFIETINAIEICTERAIALEELGFDIERIEEPYMVAIEKLLGIHYPAWNKPSFIVNTDDYEKLKATGKYVEVFRGGPKGLAEGFVSGKPWIGDGNAGPGTYVTIDKSRAEAFAGLAKNSTGGSEIVTALVPKEMLDQAPNIENSPAHSLPSKWSGKKRADYVANAANGIPAYEPSYESSAPGDYVIYNTSAIVIKGEQ